MSAQHSQYLESKVLTAAPHRLHLMLIEGAIRFGRQAEGLLHRGETAAAAAPLLRVVDIVGEMLAAVRGRNTDINKKLVDLYWYLFRRDLRPSLTPTATNSPKLCACWSSNGKHGSPFVNDLPQRRRQLLWRPIIRRRLRRDFLSRHSFKLPNRCNASAHAVAAINIMLQPTMLIAAWKTAVCRNALKWLSRAK